MLKQLTINLESLLSSNLTIDQYVILALLYKREFRVVERLVLNQFGYTDHYLGEIYHLLQDDGWIKINGKKLPDDIVVRQKFVDLLINPVDETVVIDWIDQYRELFKNTRPGGMGDKHVCISNMVRFLEAYPQYTKEDILKATKYYISTFQGKYQYLTQADYFISKTDPKTHVVTSKLAGFVEEVKSESFVQADDFTKQI